MSNPLLQTKLFSPPSRSTHVLRPQLFRKLDDGLLDGQKLSLISAPAGYGKTTLAAAWGKHLQQSPPDQSPDKSLSFAWLSLDEDDNDPARFFTYMITALQRNILTQGERFQPLLESDQTPLVQLTPQLINTLTGLERPLVLVLDDYHVITNTAIHESMTQLLEYLPPGVHLVLTTRRDPPFPLSRLRVRGQMQEIRLSELQFNNAEITRFLQGGMGIDLPVKDINTLATRTEGWIASLQLAALSLQNLDQPQAQHHFVEAFDGTHRHIVDFLLDEVLAQRPSGTRDFLLQTAILPRLCADLCGAVTGRDDSQTLLEQLDSANFFIVPMDDERRWFRYHHLFATLLQQRLRKKFPDEYTGLYARAAAWFAGNGFDAEAIDVSLQGGDMERAVHLLIRIADTAVWQQGQYVRLAHWIDQIPESIMSQHPQLCVYYAWGLFVDADRSDAAAAARWLALAEKNCAGDTPAQLDIRAQIATIHSSRTRVQAQIDETIQLATFALQNLLPASTFWQALAHFNLAAVYYLGDDIAAIERSLRASAETAQAAGDTMMAIAPVNMRGQLQVRLGRLAEAARLFEQTMSMERQKGSDQPIFFTSGLSPLGLGDLYREWNQLDEAQELLQRGLDIAQLTHHPLTLISGQIAMAQLLITKGDLDNTRKILHKTSQLIQLTGISWTWLTGPTSAALACLWLRLGEYETASEALHQGQPGMAGYWDECWHLAQARLMMAEDKWDNAKILLQKLAVVAASAGRIGSKIEILILLALTQQQQRERETAAATLAEALDLARPSGYIRIFLDEGPPLANLLASLPSSSYRNQLLDVFEYPSGTVDQTALIEPLNERELQIIRLMAARLSNREIASELFLATTTIKWYSRQIYSKLDVNSRGDAVKRARELNLI